MYCSLISIAVRVGMPRRRRADRAPQHALALNPILKCRRDFSHAVLLNLATTLARRHEIIDRWFLVSGRDEAPLYRYQLF
jgi:hypothetical protein